MSLSTRITTGFTAVAFCVLPMTAMGGAIPAQTLDEHRNACEAKCVTQASEGYCQKMCDCVTDRMSQQWDEQDYLKRFNVMSENPDNQQVRDELDEFAEYCRGEWKQ